MSPQFASVLEKPERLSHHVVPLAMTDARRGAVSGGALIAGLTALVFGLGLAALSVQGSEPLLPPGPTLALCVGLGAVLGGLAGGLSFASDSKALLQRLRGHLRRQRSILLVSGSLSLDRELQRFGPVRVGVLS